MQSPNVYVRARHLVQQLAPIVGQVHKRDRSLADQLRRAAQSIVLNIAEARGNDAGNARARFATACGSAKETRAALHVATDWGYVPVAEVAVLEDALDTVCAITWSLAHKR